MKQYDKISIPMPHLSPEAAYALAEWISRVAHEVDLYYGDHIRSHMETLDREQTELEEQIACSWDNDDEKQEEFLF